MVLVYDGSRGENSRQEKKDSFFHLDFIFIFDEQIIPAQSLLHEPFVIRVYSRWRGGIRWLSYYKVIIISEWHVIVVTFVTMGSPRMKPNTHQNAVKRVFTGLSCLGKLSTKPLTHVSNVPNCNKHQGIKGEQKLWIGGQIIYKI